VGLSRSAVTPLGYYGGSYVNFDADRQAIEATDHENVRVGAVLESDGALLFLDDGQKLSLPIAKFLGETVNEPGSLLEQLAKLEVAAAVNFVYSVYDDPKDRCIYVFYRGEIVSGPPSSQTKAVLIPFDEIPWDRLEKNAGLVRRYIRERTSDSFGLYVGTAARGSVHKTMLATSERSA
jgi:hypothetical protein